MQEAAHKSDHRPNRELQQHRMRSGSQGLGGVAQGLGRPWGENASCTLDLWPVASHRPATQEGGKRHFANEIKDEHLHAVGALDGGAQAAAMSWWPGPFREIARTRPNVGAQGSFRSEVGSQFTDLGEHGSNRHGAARRDQPRLGTPEGHQWNMMPCWRRRCRSVSSIGQHRMLISWPSLAEVHVQGLMSADFSQRHLWHGQPPPGVMC